MNRRTFFAATVGALVAGFCGRGSIRCTMILEDRLTGARRIVRSSTGGLPPTSFPKEALVKPHPGEIAVVQTKGAIHCESPEELGKKIAEAVRKL